MRPDWKRIGGLHVSDDGSIAAVWIAHDKDADCLHLYDAQVYRGEILAVVADAMKGAKAQRKWVPIAWHQEAGEIAGRLLDRGVNMLHEPIKNSDPVAEVVSREIEERMRTGRFKVADGLADWITEFKSFYRQDSRVPKDSHPLMAATRHAVAQMDYALSRRKTTETNFPKLAIV